jgi:hypothetical protein
MGISDPASAGICISFKSCGVVKNTLSLHQKKIAQQMGYRASWQPRVEWTGPTEILILGCVLHLTITK